MYGPHQPGPSLRFVDGGHAQLAKNADDVGVGPLNVLTMVGFTVITDLRSATGEALVDARKDPSHVSLEDLLLVRVADRT